MHNLDGTAANWSLVVTSVRPSIRFWKLLTLLASITQSGRLF